MRKLKVWFTPILAIVTLLGVWAYVVIWNGFLSVLTDIHGGWILSPTLKGMLVILTTVWIVVDNILPIIRQTRSTK